MTVPAEFFPTSLTFMERWPNMKGYFERKPDPEEKHNIKYITEDQNMSAAKKISGVSGYVKSEIGRQALLTPESRANAFEKFNVTAYQFLW